ncbi:hypothetical protein ACFLTO_04540 [Chloroflexota bacterium]
MDSVDLTTWVSHDLEQLAKKKARDRTALERWNRDTAVFSYAILIIVLILLNHEVGMQVVAAVSVMGLILIWFMGLLQGRRLYQQNYGEELLRLKQEVEIISKESDGEAIEEKVRKAMRDMWR